MSVSAAEGKGGYNQMPLTALSAPSGSLGVVCARQSSALMIACRARFPRQVNSPPHLQVCAVPFVLAAEGLQRPGPIRGKRGPQVNKRQSGQMGARESPDATRPML